VLDHDITLSLHAYVAVFLRNEKNIEWSSNLSERTSTPNVNGIASWVQKSSSSARQVSLTCRFGLCSLCPSMLKLTKKRGL